MTLREGKVGESYLVEAIDLQKGTEMRLEAMGLTQGTSILLVNKKKSGSVIFKVRGTRLAVGCQIAEKIYVYSR